MNTAQLEELDEKIRTLQALPSSDLTRAETKELLELLERRVELLRSLRLETTQTLEAKW